MLNHVLCYELLSQTMLSIMVLSMIHDTLNSCYVMIQLNHVYVKNDCRFCQY